MKTIIMSLLVTMTSTVFSQDIQQALRTIEVSGSHEIKIEPETIYFNINIEEYWAEEFEGKKWEDFKTKIEIEKIESDLINELKTLGIGMDQITLKGAGNYWRSRGKDFLINKNLELKLTSFETVNNLSNALKTRGIKSMNVTKLDHSKLDDYKIQVKKEALKKAKSKAEELVAVYDQSLGKAVSIIEIDGNMNIKPMVQGQARTYKMSAESNMNNNVQYENFRQITLRAAMRVAFQID